MKTLAMGPDDTISEAEHLVTLKVYIPDLLIQVNFIYQINKYASHDIMIFLSLVKEDTIKKRFYGVIYYLTTLKY